MKLTAATRLALSLAGLLGSANSAPTPAATTPAPAGAQIFERTINYCGDTMEWISETTGGSPLWRDCLEIVNRQVEPFHQLQITGDYRVLIRHGTCAFGAKALTLNSEPDGSIPIWWTNIGDEDIRDLVIEAVNRFKWYEFAGGRGLTQCAESIVEWAIYRG